AAEAQADQSDSDVVDAEAGFHTLALHVRRIADEKVRQNQRNDSDRDVDVENPAPGIIVGNPAAEPWTDCGRDDDSDSVDSESHTALFERERVVKDGLLARLQSAAAGALQNAEEHQHSQIGGQAAQKRADSKKSNANHVKTLAAYQAREPSRK